MRRRALGWYKELVRLPRRAQAVPIVRQNRLADVLKKKLQGIPYCQLIVGELVWIKRPVYIDLRFERHA
jgi:hypothetical protein